MEETRKDLLADLKIEDALYPSLEALVKGEHKYIRDLRINLKNALQSESLGGKKNAYLIALAVAVNEKNRVLAEAFTELAKTEGATQSEIAEIHAIASLLASLNVFYRFRHFSSNKSYEDMPAGIKMTIMARPGLGKQFFELVALAVSAVNGCETCVNNHEKSVRQEGASEQTIFDAIRLASIVKGLTISFQS
ncbi:alkylhydroperoxidase like protein, AhpD family [Chloroherpeton thalassium ATCC 35110]|uniref:Alkyl hydroperoxide reductase AhpD n=1 Tax=Chloroherpeton thalassium (strain ATCC 35110 / GB-78) TaxID=517418 RepID=B3QWF3_CHLT3|nr:carboxymuconolactone decarboxylase family protein [Chloroherpeton thalassium]ACF14713.1 alkylhydroperoxidase like protein, AhpD family [Chloroherpeton thalassium ATCC 35110]